MQETSQENEAKSKFRRYLCPCCGKHTVLWLLPTTQVKDLPIKCKRCGKESVISIMPVAEGLEGQLA